MIDLEPGPVGQLRALSYFERLIPVFPALTTTANSIPPLSLEGVCFDLLVSRNGSFWLGTSQCLYTCKAQKWSRLCPDQRILPGKQIQALAEDSQGYLWIATDRGLVRWKGGL